jgi:ABC-type phosphate transport system auxiliary subunit
MGAIAFFHSIRYQAMAGLRIECALADIEEIERRLKHVFHTNRLSKVYQGSSSLNRYYLRIYLDEKDTLLDQLLATQQYANDLVIEREELLAQITQLKQQLAELPQPKPYDAVLGGKCGRNL